MEEKTLEEMLQEETPVTEEASGEKDAGQAPDPETAKETAAEAGQPQADQENTDDTQDQPADESDEEETGDEAGDEGNDEKKGFFSRRKKGDKEKAALKEKIEGLEDRVKRQMAEFDNFRKRTEKEKQQMFSMGERSVIEKMLPHRRQLRARAGCNPGGREGRPRGQRHGDGLPPAAEAARGPWSHTDRGGRQGI